MQVQAQLCVLLISVSEKHGFVPQSMSDSVLPISVLWSLHCSGSEEMFGAYSSTQTRSKRSFTEIPPTKGTNSVSDYLLKNNIHEYDPFGYWFLSSVSQIKVCPWVNFIILIGFVTEMKTMLNVPVWADETFQRWFTGLADGCQEENQIRSKG